VSSNPGLTILLNALTELPIKPAIAICGKNQGNNLKTAL
jgi:hypothetical protein